MYANRFQRPASPSKFTSQATDSPSKLNVPSRKQRNSQPSNRVHDIEFATEISTSLLAQVRQLQGLLVERDDNLKKLNLEKSRLELEAQGFSQRLRSLDESEQRYKDENWALETQTHELIAAAKESADREQRLQQVLNVTISEKSAAQRELDDIKQAHVKLSEDHMAFRKAHDVETAALWKRLATGESDKSSLQRKLEELTSQNQELAKAVAIRYKGEEDLPIGDIGSEPEELSLNRSDAEYSPPGSPSKGGTRHTMLESETLKSSLHHAHRMIQNLKGNIHREKSEKLDLKRMLQEARDELEIRRGESGGASNGNKRLKSKSQADMVKKAPKASALGMGRHSRTDIEVNDNDWEDHKDESSLGYEEIERASGIAPNVGHSTDAYQTANDTEDAFETANERETSTETEAFLTGNESLAGESSDELTETEDGPGKAPTARQFKGSSIVTAKLGQRNSFISTASTSGSDEEHIVSTPVQQPQKYRLKLNRYSRRSRLGSEGPTSSGPSSTRNSPASFISTSGQQRQSLFAELGELGGDDVSDDLEGTPSRASVISYRSIPASRPSTAKQVAVESLEPMKPPLPMVDSGMMTEAWEPPLSDHSGSGMAAGRTIATPATPRFKEIGVQGNPTAAPQPIGTSTTTATTPRKAWDTPLKDFVANIPTFGPALTSTPISTRSGASREVQYADSPIILEAVRQKKSDISLAAKRNAEALPAVLSFSQIRSLESRPLEPAPAIPSRDARRMPPTDDPLMTTNTSDPRDYDSTKSSGVLGSVLGWAKTKGQRTPQIAVDETDQDSETRPTDEGNRTPFKEVAANLMQRESTTSKAIPNKIDDELKADHGSQTILSAQQIDEILSHKANKPLAIVTGGPQRMLPNTTKLLGDMKASSSPVQHEMPQDGTRPTSKAIPIREAAPLTKAIKRPGSSGSIRTSGTIMPPLPQDHRQAIAAAAQRTPAADGTANTMGPPIAPASAYRSNSARPRTPSEQRGQPQTPNTRTSTTPRARYSTMRSQMSRRSSITSFESEIDRTFNIRSDGMPMPPGLDAAADPRMIQAITQTMIGEYLWKYTRKAGRGEMSDNRHRRFFWVHPYTRILYWSNQDPSTAGRAQLKAKSVAIEGVRVVTDDNPMPPGLHRKSIIILTPGRAVKFTATTGQRHETWFNSLSYLILRTGNDPYQYADENGLTAEDIAEFDPSARARMSRAPTRGSHASLSSYNSRPVTASRQSSRAGSPNRTQSVRSVQQAMRQDGASHSSRYAEARHGSVASRFSSYWRPGRSSVQGSLSSRHGKGVPGQDGSIYDASVVHDSAEDLRQVIERQEEGADQLENVRACCDGKFGF